MDKQMKNRRLLKRLVCTAAVLGVIAAFLYSCAKKPEKSGRLSVVASVYPVFDFASKIAGGNADVTLLVPPGAEPHDWEPRTSDIARLENADIFIYSGAGLEHWVSDVLASLNNKKLLVVDTSAELQLLGESGKSDPHIWLDPANAEMQLAAIQRAFYKKDRDGEYHTKNRSKYSGEFTKLREEYSRLWETANRNLVSTHSAFGYLCAAYGLTQTSVEGFSPEGEPSPVRMAEIVEFVKQNGVSTVFYESGASKNIAEAVAREAGAETAFLNTLEWLTEEQIKNNEDYFSVMRTNLEVILNALNS